MRDPDSDDVDRSGIRKDARMSNQTENMISQCPFVSNTGMGDRILKVLQLRQGETKINKNTL